MIHPLYLWVIKMFTGFHPEVDDPLEEENDEVALMVAGHGKEHGRTRILSLVMQPTRTLTQIRATLTADHPLSRLHQSLVTM
jgi:hypothetical protein